MGRTPTPPVLLSRLLVNLAGLLAVFAACPAAPAAGSGDATQAAPPAPSLSVPQDWPSAQELLRLPPWLAVAVDYTAEPIINPLGGSASQSGWIGQTAVALQLSTGLTRSTEQWRELDHWSLHTAVNHYSGNAYTSEAIGALFPLQQIAYPPGTLLSEFSLHRSAGNGLLQLKAGLLPLNPSFITAPAFNAYVHSAFNNTLNISVPALPLSPYAALGGVAMLHPSAELSIGYGWFDLSSTAPVARWLGSIASWQGSGSAQLLQLSWVPGGQAAAAASLPGCRTGGKVMRRSSTCEQPVLVQNQLPSRWINLGGYSLGAAGGGIYGSATVSSGLPMGLGDRLWVGAAWSGGEAGSINPTFVAGGLLVQGVLPHRPLDLLILGGGHAALQPGVVSSWPSNHEAMLELGYQWQLNSSLALQPTLQWIFNPSAGPQPLAGILAASLQLSLSF
jgi:porin